MKTFACRDAGMSCDYVAKGADEGQVLQDAIKHGKEAHGFKDADFTPQMKDKIRGMIKDEGDQRARAG